MNGRMSRVRPCRALLLAAAAACLLAACGAPAAGASSTVAAGTVTLLTDAPQSEAMFLGGISPFFEPPATLRLTQDAWRFTCSDSGGHDWVTVAGVPATMTLWLKHQLTSASPRYRPTDRRLGTVIVRAR